MYPSWEGCPQPGGGVSPSWRGSPTWGCPHPVGGCPHPGTHTHELRGVSPSWWPPQGGGRAGLPWRNAERKAREKGGGGKRETGRKGGKREKHKKKNKQKKMSLSPGGWGGRPPVPPSVTLQGDEDGLVRGGGICYCYHDLWPVWGGMVGQVAGGGVGGSPRASSLLLRARGPTPPRRHGVEGALCGDKSGDSRMARSSTQYGGGGGAGKGGQGTPLPRPRWTHVPMGVLGRVSPRVPVPPLKAGGC